MKFSKLLVLSAFALMGTNAMAGVPDDVWTIPEPQGLEFTDVTFDDDVRYYLYNPTAKMFFASGNEWNTRAGIASFGYEVWFTTISSTGEEAPEGSYFFNDNCQHPDRIMGDKDLFTDGGGSTWVDHNWGDSGQTDYLWSVTKEGDSYRIQNTLFNEKEGNEGKFFGWKGDYADTRLYMVTEGAIDWKFVTTESYEAFKESDAYTAYSTAVSCYGQALSLKAALEEAAELGANIDAQLAVYTNTASTLEELKSATDALNTIIDARKSLKKALDEAKAKGFTDTAAYDAVYANGNATADELKKAQEDLGNALVEWGKGHASVENPADMSAKIVNPNFDNASYTGWSGTAPNMVGSGSHGPANVAEKWNDTFDTYQEITGLPAGLYALGAQTMWRGSWNDMVNGVGPAAFLYAKVGELEMKTPFNYAYGPLNTTSMAGNTPWGVGAGEQNYTDEETGITYYIPNDPSCFRLYAEAGLYDTQVMFAVEEGDTIRIGVKNPSKLGDADNWACFDTFTLTFFGNGADAAALYLPEALKNYGPYEVEDGVIYTPSYLTAYNQAISGDDKVASSMAEASTILGGIDEAKRAIETNISLWSDFQKALDEATEMVTVEDYSSLLAMDDLADYMMDASELLDNPTMTNEELEAEVAKVRAMIQAVLDEFKEQTPYDGKDMTKFIKNPGFDEDKDINSGAAEGWTIDSGTGGNITRGPLGQGNKDLMEGALGYMNWCFEAWHRYNWDVWQEIENLPVGMYQLDVQGYVRCEVGGYNRGDELGDSYPSPVYLYMNDARSSFPSVYSESLEEAGNSLTLVEDWTIETVNDLQYPNSMGGAAQCFAWGMYKTTAFGLIAKQGDKFRIGVKMNGNQDWWCIFDSFRLTYRTPTADIVKPILDEEMVKLDLSQPMGKDVYETAAALKAKVDAATDGQAMFDALAEVFALSASIEESIALFKELEKEGENLAYAIDASEASAETKAEAQALKSQIQAACSAPSDATNAEAQAMIDAIPDMLTKLAMPADMANASDANPVECTGVIKSASFEDSEGMSTSAGWKNPGNLGNDDTQKSALAMEFWQVAFDMSQTIKGLPAGTYKVTVDAWCRMGGNQESYDAFLADPEASMAYIYAVNGDSIVYSAPIANLFKAGDGVIGAEEFAAGENVYYVPNDLVSGKDNLTSNEGIYTNEVIAKVGADGQLTVGIKKAEQKTNSWVVLDDFRLFYLGANSSQNVSGDPSGIETAETAAQLVEFFNLNGARINKPGKGVVLMKRTAADGTVKVQKVVVK